MVTPRRQSSLVVFAGLLALLALPLALGGCATGGGAQGLPGLDEACIELGPDRAPATVDAEAAGRAALARAVDALDDLPLHAPPEPSFTAMAAAVEADQEQQQPPWEFSLGLFVGSPGSTAI